MHVGGKAGVYCVGNFRYKDILCCELERDIVIGWACPGLLFLPDLAHLSAHVGVTLRIPQTFT